jgi:hypothetical protein
MATLDIPGDLYTQLQAKAEAEAEGKTVDEMALETLRESLDRESIIDIADRFSKKYASRVKYTPEQVPDVVHEWREEQHRR